MVKVHRAADGFYRALHSGEELEDEIERNAAFDARVRIELHLEKMHCVLSRMDDFKNATEGFLTAAFFEMREVQNAAGKGYVEWEAWNRLIRDLSQWFKGKGLPVAASKGQDKSNSKPSAFVAFMRALQLTFPENFRRHMASDAALAKGISDARINQVARDRK